MDDWQQKRVEQREVREQELHRAWTQDAQMAWDEGQAFYQPIIPANVVREIMTSKRRGGEAEQALHAITAVGWRLHTWAVSAAGALPNEYGIGVYAHPLFVR